MTDAPPTEPAPAPPAEPAPPPPSPAVPRLPGRVTAAALILLVFGTLSALGSALTLLWSLVFIGRMGGMGFMRFNDGFGGGGFGGGFGGPAGWTSLLFVFLAVGLAVAVSGGHLAAGWGVLQRESWGRVLGLVVSSAALVLIVLGILGTFVWIGTLPDLREFDRIPWFTEWFRNVMTAGLTLGVLVSLAAATAYAFVLIVLARADEVFG